MADPTMESGAALEPRIVEVVLSGHLTLESLRASLDIAEKSVSAADGAAVLLVNCQRMSAYDAAARQYFVDWNRKMQGSIRRLAVVTDRTMWQLVVSVMALASGQAMKGFAEPASAQHWLRG